MLLIGRINSLLRDRRAGLVIGTAAVLGLAWLIADDWDCEDPHYNGIELGMSTEEVVSVMGRQPDAVFEYAGVLIFYYDCGWSDLYETQAAGTTVDSPLHLDAPVDRPDQYAHLQLMFDRGRSLVADAIVEESCVRTTIGPYRWIGDVLAIPEEDLQRLIDG